jgi:RNA polymerase sigma-70 factor (ECF subfamily)
MAIFGRTPAALEGDILTRVQQGSPKDFEALYDRYCGLAFAVAIRVLSDESAAEDVVQGAFLAIWRNAATYRAELGSARNWICSIVRSRAIDRLRGDGGRDLYDLALDECIDELALSDTLAEVAASLSRQQINGAMDKLPLEERQSIELAYWCGMSPREIGDTMRVPLGTVKGRVRFGLAKLRETLLSREQSRQAG